MIPDVSKMTPQQLYTFGMGVITFIVTQLVAYVPTLGTDKQNLISGGGIVLSAAIVLGGGIHHLAQSRSAGATGKQLVTQAEMSVEEKLRQQISAAGMVPKA